ncbi:hypothetical protein TEA_018669 [Camellia sinensis var. sinensis]|uniref:Uncharacterized protein n=1 Tax=Camellia sinensis var. sinensis TaxID=542762 RepID=A0A4S4EFU4_CAMSN|nr:hypothetical protein TEA_018669 [Camellia sinensis var. sinensis]
MAISFFRCFFLESLAKFPRRASSTPGFHGQPQQLEEQLQQQAQQQTMGQNSRNDQSSVQATAMQAASSNGVPNANNSLNSASTTSSTSTIVGLLQQSSMNSRQPNPMNNANSPYGGSGIQIPSPGSSSTMPHAQPNPSPFQSPTPSSSNTALQNSHGGLTAAAHMSSANSPNISMQQQPALSSDADPSDSQSSVQKIIQEMMMSTQMNGGGGMVGVGSLGNDVKNVNGMDDGSGSPERDGDGNGDGDDNEERERSAAIAKRERETETERQSSQNQLCFTQERASSRHRKSPSEIASQAFSLSLKK